MSLKPVILDKNMDPLTFAKNDYSVTFPRDALNKLYDMSMGAENINVEINARLLVKNREVRGVLFPAINQIVVVITKLPFEIKANNRKYFDDTGKALIDLMDGSYHSKTGEIDYGLVKSNLIILKNVLTKYDSRLSYKKENDFIELHPDDIDLITKNSEAMFNVINDLKDKDAYASEWFSSKPLRSFKISNSEKIFENGNEKQIADINPDEVIRIHNHPVGFPSPPSCWIRDNKIKGDVSEILEGGTYGNLLHRGKGKWELVLFREGDLTNVPKYIELFSDFWSWFRDRSEVAENIRRLALQPIRKSDEE